jgi:hypothetical protein
MLGEDIAGHGRSRFEVEYDCAYFSGLPISLLILERSSSQDPGGRIALMRKLQELAGAQRKRMKQQDTLNLFLEFHSRVSELIGFPSGAYPPE